MLTTCLKLECAKYFAMQVAILFWIWLTISVLNISNLCKNTENLGCGGDGGTQGKGGKGKGLWEQGDLLSFLVVKAQYRDRRKTREMDKTICHAMLGVANEKSGEKSWNTLTIFYLPLKIPVQPLQMLFHPTFWISTRTFWILFVLKNNDIPQFMESILSGFKT